VSPMWFHMRLLEKCNLHCTSCYAKHHHRSSMMSYPLFADAISAIQAKVRVDHGMSVIYLSGGEPLLHPDLFKMMDLVVARFDRVSILTNGLLVSRYIDRFDAYREKLCVQVSLDGDKEKNDEIRGKGVFDRVVEALTLLDRNRIRHLISYTVSQTNKTCFKEILNVAKQTRSVFNNVTPYTGDPDLMLSYFEWKEFKHAFEKYSKRIQLENAHGPQCCGFTYDCGAFNGGITINPDGSLAGCARLNNIKGHYSETDKTIGSERLSMAQACMKAKWGDIRQFDLLTRLE
jgi:MoaA/NifB/PqqE/SkfB family radical SAM enzyme